MIKLGVNALLACGMHTLMFCTQERGKNIKKYCAVQSVSYLSAYHKGSFKWWN
jgi:hypothetical protein